MPVKTSQTTHQQAAGKESMPAGCTWPSAGPLTPMTFDWRKWKLWQRDGRVWDAWSRGHTLRFLLRTNWRFWTIQSKVKTRPLQWHDKFSQPLQKFSGRRLLGTCDKSQVMPKRLDTQRFIEKNRENTADSLSGSEHQRPASLQMGLMCECVWERHCMYMTVWVTGSLSQSVSMKVHVQMCESVSHNHVFEQTNLDISGGKSPDAESLNARNEKNTD